MLHLKFDQSSFVVKIELIMKNLVEISVWPVFRLSIFKVILFRMGTDGTNVVSNP